MRPGIYNEPLRSCIPFPELHYRDDIEAWLAAIEPYLPAHLRQTPSSNPDISSTVTSFDIAAVLYAARRASFDLISHLGLVEGRWQVAVWIAKKLVEDGTRSTEPPVQLGPSLNAIWLDDDTRSLKELTENSIHTEGAGVLRKSKLSLDALTAAPESIDRRHVLVKRALGQLWECLGNMILTAAEQTDTEESTIMPYVLEIIAYLHHVGFMPDSVYSYRPRKDQYALQQPPTLHMLSSKILTALSDATWKAHESSVKAAKDSAKVSYFLGHEIPGSRYKVEVTEVAPELWLELILWSCLRGGWIMDGAAILGRLASKEEDRRWALISWREIMEAEEQKTSASSQAWSLFPRNRNASASPQDRARTRRTISGEVVTAFVDGLVNQMRLGVGYRGADPEIIIGLLKTLKDFLDANNLSLGSTAWDSIMARLLESGGIVPEKRPELLLQIIDLASGFGVEVGATNASASVDAEIPYFFEPTTMPLSLLHRTMRAFMENGDIKGAMQTLMLLQQHTDENKQKSVQQFFEMLKSVPQSRKDEPFTSRLLPVEFPAFDIKLPVPLLARLLDLATESKLYDLGQWLLFSNDLDGPLIGPDLYGHRNMAASIVRFGAVAGADDLVLEIIRRVGFWNEKYQQQRMPAEVLIALLCCQLKLHRWESVRRMQKYVEETSTFRPRPVILSTFAAELFRSSVNSSEAKVQAQEAFSELLFAWEDLLMDNVRNEVYCILAIMSTVDIEWKEYCSQFLAHSLRQNIKLATDDFNRLLSGVVDRYDSSKGKTLVQQWCYQAPHTFEPYRAPGGLPRMPQYHTSKGDEFKNRPENIEIDHDSGTKIILQGRILPNRQTILIILRTAQEEVESCRQRSEEFAEITRTEVRDTLKWAVQLLSYLGFDYEDICRDLGDSLVELAEF